MTNTGDVGTCWCNIGWTELEVDKSNFQRKTFKFPCMQGFVRKPYIVKVNVLSRHQEMALETSSEPMITQRCQPVIVLVNA